jgi:hypothetical protein
VLKSNIVLLLPLDHCQAAITARNLLCYLLQRLQLSNTVDLMATRATRTSNLSQRLATETAT